MGIALLRAYVLDGMLASFADLLLVLVEPFKHPETPGMQHYCTCLGYLHLNVLNASLHSGVKFRYLP